MTLIDYNTLEGSGAEERAAQFRLAEPFPHIVIEDTLVGDAGDVAGAFPDSSWEGWQSRTSQHQPGKWSCRDIDIMPLVIRELILDLSGPRFLRVLSSFTGIPKLLPDPFLDGGGLQYTEAGGKLLPHTDFHFHPSLQLFRRVNVLLYLNPNWQSADGGELLLYNLGDEQPTVVVPPRYGTCVVFTTDHRSVHGVKPLIGAARRRTIALYYYTVEETEVFSGDRRTYWYDQDRARPTDAVSQARLATMKAALGASKALTRLAYRVDPQRPDLI